MHAIQKFEFNPSGEALKQDKLDTHIDGLWFFPSEKHSDSRGYFSQVATWPEIEDALGQPFIVSQYNHAHSKERVMRGFHAEDWNKLAYVGRGVVFCALIDLRPESDTFLHVEQLFLGDTSNSLRGTLFIPKGLANSVCVVDGPVDYYYLVDKLYSERDTENDRAINLYDKDIGVDWPVSVDEAIVSDRDRDSIFLKDYFPDLDLS